MDKGNIVVSLVGLSGAGKTTIEEGLKERHGDKIHKIRSSTTREKRDNDAPGAYEYLDKKEFQRDVDRGLFLEHAQFGDKRYGSKISEYETGKPTIIVQEEEGAKNLKKLLAARGQDHKAILIKAGPDSTVTNLDFKAARERMKTGRNESDDSIEKRLAVDHSRKDELNRMIKEGEFDEVIHNTGSVEDLPKILDHIDTIIGLDKK